MQQVLQVSCSKSDDGGGDGISDQTLTGSVEGKAFTFVGGKAFETTNFNEETVISLNLTNVAANCDDFISDFVLRISADVPNAIGVYSDINIADRDSNDGDGGISFNNNGETVEITAISATKISGKMRISRPASVIAPESVFEGTFTLPLCQ